MGDPIKGTAYQNRRKRILAASAVCGICAQEVCPHCHGDPTLSRTCGGGLSHIDHGKARAKGGPVDITNETATHACCNLKKGAGDQAPEILRTSKNW